MMDADANKQFLPHADREMEQGACDTYEELLRLSIMAWATAVENAEDYVNERAGEPDYDSLDFSHLFVPLVEIEVGLQRHITLLTPENQDRASFNLASERLLLLRSESQQGTR